MDCCQSIWFSLAFIFCMNASVRQKEFIPSHEYESISLSVPFVTFTLGLFTNTAKISHTIRILIPVIIIIAYASFIALRYLCWPEGSLTN